LSISFQRALLHQELKKNFELDVELIKEQMERLKTRDLCWRKFDPLKVWRQDVFSMSH
jgi:hypothetical protein